MGLPGAELPVAGLLDAVPPDGPALPEVLPGAGFPGAGFPGELPGRLACLGHHQPVHDAMPRPVIVCCDCGATNFPLAGSSQSMGCDSIVSAMSRVMGR